MTSLSDCRLYSEVILAIFDYRATAEWAWKNRIGQCSENASLTYYILKTAGVPGNVRIFGAANHEFTVWGVRDGADPNDPATWGLDTRVVDSWLGDVLNPEGAYTSRWISKNGKSNLTDQTNPFDKEAKPWTIAKQDDPSTASNADCFIATATYGTPLATDIQVLRDFRDSVLLRSEEGRALVEYYYRTSPPLAHDLAQNSWARAIVRERALKPLVILLRFTQGLWRDPSMRVPASPAGKF